MGRLDERTRSGLLALYDVPDPEATAQRIPGYDRDHAARATEIVLLVASGLGLDNRWQRDLEITALLHDIGRAGMEPTLFGQVFSLAAELGLPVRAKELRSKYPEVDEREATAFFLDLIGPSLRERGIPVDDTLIDHIRMRMDFKGRLRQVLDDKRQDLDRLGVSVHPWMEKVMLYYYYPEEMTGEAEEARLMGMTLVACENFEAFSNRRRGRDYYRRDRERLRDVFTVIGRFQEEGLVSAGVVSALKRVLASGRLDDLIRESRDMMPGERLPDDDLEYIRSLQW